MRQLIESFDASANRRGADRPGSGQVALLVIGDSVSFLCFAIVGLHQHAETRSIGLVVATAAPFALGWFIVSPFVGAFHRVTIKSPVRMLVRTELAWLCAWPVTLVLRWWLSSDHLIPASFAIVILLSNALFLGAWRGAFALVMRKSR
jgi:hypothetical protein